MRAIRWLSLWVAVVWLVGCGGEDPSSNTSGGHSNSAGPGGDPGSGGTAASSGSSGGGATGSGGAPAWSATPEWTNLPIPLQFGPSLAAHPVDPQTLSILANTYAPEGTTLVAATSSDLGSTFPQTATLSPIGQTSMVEPKGIAYNPKAPEEISAVVWIQGPREDPAGGGHLYRSTDAGQSFTEAPLSDVLPFNALAFTSVRYTSSGALALRVNASVVHSLDGVSVSKTIDTSDCAAQPGNSAFDVDPEDGSRVAVPCGDSIALCSAAGCNKTNVSVAVVDVRYGPDPKQIAAIGRTDQNTFVALVSEDGGATFNQNQTFQDNVSPSWRVGWDPRPGTNTVYALLVSHLFRSSDGGATWQDITPPPELNYIYDFVVAADGTVIGRGVFHYLLLSPAS